MPKNKRKKKTSSLQPKRIVEAQQKKDFFNKVRLILKATGCPGLLSQLTEIDLKNLFDLRFTPIKFSAGRSDIKAIDIKIFGSGVKDMLNMKKYILANEHIEVSAYDLLTAGLTLFGYIKNHSERNPEAYQHLLEQLKPLENVLVQKNGPFDHKDTFVCTMCLFNSNITQQLYYTKQVKPINHKTFTNCDIQELYKYIPSRRNVRIDGINRTVYQVGWYTNNTYLPSVIHSEKIESDTPFPKAEYKVFTQAHALNRLNERLNEEVNGLLHIEMFSSILSAEKFRYYRDRIYIDYYYGKQKAGYLVGEIIGSIVVIKTFLFLTHSSTPEGERLKDLTGLNKLDMKFLNIDKLRVFQESDIKTNPSVKQIFIDAGCASLFEIRKNEFTSANLKLANKVMKYMEDTRKDYNCIEELETDMLAQAR